jgi:tetratricopeptide (TPR) repeat protein
MALFAGRRFQQAIAWNLRALELDSTLTLAEQFLGNDYVFAGQAEKAVQVLERADARDPRQFLSRGSLIFAYAASGRWEDVRRLYHDLTRKSANAADFDLMDAYLAVGDRQKALNVFEHWARNGLGNFATGCDPIFDPLHNEPRFLAIMHRFGVGVCPVTTPWPIKPPPADFTVIQ